METIINLFKKEILSGMRWKTLVVRGQLWLKYGTCWKEMGWLKKENILRDHEKYFSIRIEKTKQYFHKMGNVKQNNWKTNGLKNNSNDKTVRNLHQLHFYVNNPFYYKQFSLARVHSLIVKNISISNYSSSYI